jgi:glutamine amidotransferase
MSLLNIGGFGLVAWDDTSPLPERPYVYRTPNVPVFDRNLKALAEKLHVTSALAHVRGVVYEPGETVGPQNLHPFSTRMNAKPRVAPRAAGQDAPPPGR